MKFSLDQVKEFQKRARIVLERGHLKYSCGLCYEMSGWPNSCYDGSVVYDEVYDIMRILGSEIVHRECDFYGPGGVMTETRIMVLLLITTVSAKELQEMINA